MFSLKQHLPRTNAISKTDHKNWEALWFIHSEETFSTQFIEIKQLAFFQGHFQGAKIYCYANFFGYANFLLFSDQISGG